MSEPPQDQAADNTFERIKRIRPQGNESWSARTHAGALEYSRFRNFQPVIEKAKEAWVKSGHSVADHFAERRNMVGIGSGAQREIEDWALSRYAGYLVIQNADPSKPLSGRSCDRWIGAGNWRGRCRSAKHIPRDYAYSSITSTPLRARRTQIQFPLAGLRLEFVSASRSPRGRSLLGLFPHRSAGCAFAA